MTILDFDSNVFMAPMAGITDKPLRKLVSSLGPGVMVSEMVAVNAIQRKNPKTYRIADVSDEPYPVVVQLVGGNPELFYDAAQLVAELGAHSIDINMGCPVKKIVNNHSGSALMKDLKLASSIIRSVVDATPLKVSVKFRKGWDLGSVNAVEFAKMCEDSGAAYLTIHGRTRSAFYSGEADWNIIREVKQAVNIPVIGNGNIIDSETFAFRAGLNGFPGFGADGFMIGRGGVARPWLFKRLSDLQNGAAAGFEVDLTAVFDRFTELLRLYQPPEFYPSRLSRFLFYFCGNFRFGHRLFSEVKKAGRNGNEMEAAVRGYLNRHPEERFSRI